MTLDIDLIKDEMASLNEVALLEIVTVQRGEYAAEALEQAWHELARRGVTSEQVEDYQARHQATVAEERSRRGGLGGWLILVGLSLAVYSLLTTYTFFTLVVFLAEGGLLEHADDTATTIAMMFAQFLTFAPVGLLSLASWTLLVLFLRKSWRFPKLFLIFLGALAALDLMWAALSLGQGGEAVGSAMVGAVLKDAYFLFWLPYMKNSERVRLTFVEGGGAPRPSA